MQKSTTLSTQIEGRFSKSFEVKTEKETFYYINFYFMGGRLRIQAPFFEILPNTDYLVTFVLAHTVYKDTKGYEKTAFRPVSVLSVKPL